MDIQQTTKNLDALQKKADDIKQQRNKLEGEAQALKNRLSELETRSENEVGVNVSELPSVILDYESKIEKYTLEIETILGNV